MTGSGTTARSGTKAGKKGIGWWLAGLFLLLLLSLFNHRDYLLRYLLNAAIDLPDFEIVAVQGSRFRLDSASVGRVRVHYRQYQLTLNQLRLGIDRSQPYWLSAVGIESGLLKFALPSGEQPATDRISDYESRQLVAAGLGWLAMASESLPRLQIRQLRLLPIISQESVSALKAISLKLVPRKPIVVTHFGWSPQSQGELLANIRYHRQPLLSLSVMPNVELQQLTGEFELSLASANSLGRSLLVIAPSLANRVIAENLLDVKGKVTGDFALDIGTRDHLWLFKSSVQLGGGTVIVAGDDTPWRFEAGAEIQGTPEKISLALAKGSLLDSRISPALWSLMTSRLSVKPSLADPLAEVLPLAVKVGLDDPLLLEHSLTDPSELTITQGSITADVEGTLFRGNARLTQLDFSDRQLQGQWQLAVVGREPLQQRLPIAVDRVSATFSGELALTPESAEILLNPDSRVNAGELNKGGLQLEQLTLELEETARVGWHISTGLAPVKLNVNSLFNGVKGPDLAIEEILGRHQVTIEAEPTNNSNNGANNRAKLVSQSLWQLGGLSAESREQLLLEEQLLSGRLQFKEQSLLFPLSWWQQPPELLDIDGLLALSLDYRLELASANLSAIWQGSLTQALGSFDEHQFHGLNAQAECSLKKAVLRCPSLELGLETLNSGLVINNISATAGFLMDKDPWQLAIKSVRAELLDGSFSSQDINIISGVPVSGTITLDHISLEAVVALQQQQGVSVNGFLDGELPFTLDQEGLTIVAGRLANQPPGGEIRISDNPAIDQLRLSQPQLEYALNALEWLDYDSLTTDLDYQKDGLATLAVSIRGRNPDIERPIHFNYTHEENLLQLLKSLRIGDELSEQLSEQLEKKE